MHVQAPTIAACSPRTVRPDVCLEVGPAPDSCDVKQLVSPRAPVGKANLAGHWSAGAVQPLPREGHV